MLDTPNLIKLRVAVIAQAGMRFLMAFSSLRPTS
jgi:hypothetical protein